MHVSIRELKAHLSQYLSQAQAGEAVEVTSHRKVVARIVGVPEGVPEGAGDGLARLLGSGAAAWSGGKPAGASLRLSPTGSALSQMVLEDRG